MKKLIIMVFVIVLAIALVGCAGQEPATPEEPETPDESQSIHLIYSQLEPEEHPQGITMLAFAQKVEELSGGQITVETHGSGTLYTQEGEVTALMDGDLDMSTLAFQDMGPYLPAANMFAAPYIFTSYEHMERVFATDSDVAKDFYSMVEEACGYTPLAAMTQGQRCVNVKTTNPIMRPEDMSDILLRMPNAPAWIAAGESLGAKVIPIAYAETYTALQTGVADGQDNPLPGTFAMKFYEVTDQISLTKHIIDVKLMVINTETFNQLNDQQKAWIREAAAYACAKGSEATYEQEAELLSFMRDEAGLIITEPDIDAFQAYSLNYYQENGLTAEWDMDLYNRIQEMK